MTLNKTIIITRPIGDEAEIRDALQESGHHVICEPLTEILLHHTARAELAHVLMQDPDAVLITSRHGAQALALLTEDRDISLLCVGENTAHTAENLGFYRVTMAGDNVDQMIDHITSAYDDDARFLYVSGEHVTVDLGEVLAIRGMQVARVIAYEAIAADAFSDTLVEQIKRGQIDAVTFFSTRTVQIFLTLAQKHNLLNDLKKIDVFCLSENIAQAAEIASWRGIYSAREAKLASLLDCVDNTLKETGSK